MRIWDDLLTEADRAVIERGQYGQRRGFGDKPLLLIIDLQPNYAGANQPAEDQVEEWPSGAGERAWQALDRILEMRDLARECKIPVIYTRNVQQAGALFDSFAAKTRRDQSKYLDGAPEADLLPCVQPRDDEVVMAKSYASAFYGTPLEGYLTKLGINTIIIVGGTTGGCCRATAVDAAARNYNLGFVEDCLFDRIEASHKIALLDVWMKYGDVITSDEIRQYFLELAR